MSSPSRCRERGTGRTRLQNTAEWKEGFNLKVVQIGRGSGHRQAIGEANDLRRQPKRQKRVIRRGSGGGKRDPETAGKKRAWSRKQTRSKLETVTLIRAGTRTLTYGEGGGERCSNDETVMENTRVDREEVKSYRREQDHGFIFLRSVECRYFPTTPICVSCVYSSYA